MTPLHRAIGVPNAADKSNNYDKFSIALFSTIYPAPKDGRKKHPVRARVGKAHWMLNLSIRGDGIPHPRGHTDALYSNERVRRSAKKDFGVTI
jgi:hypothetical protein